PVAERFHTPELRHVPGEPHASIGITATVKGLSDHCVVDRQMARLDVDLGDWLTVDSHLQELAFGQLLIVALTDTVLPASLLPGSVIERTLIAFVAAACELAAPKDLVQLLDITFELLGLMRSLVLDDASPLFVLTATSRIVPEHQRVRRGLW